MRHAGIANSLPARSADFTSVLYESAIFTRTDFSSILRQITRISFDPNFRRGVVLP